MSDVATLIQKSRELILAGNLEEATKVKDQAIALKALDDEIKSKRLDFGVGGEQSTTITDTPTETANDIATKSWYMRQFGDTGTAMDQVMSELYGRDHRKFAWAKSADFVRYIRTGQADAQLHRALVYSPTQVEGFLQLGMSVAELKATQVESQDQLGKHNIAA